MTRQRRHLTTLAAAVAAVVGAMAISSPAAAGRFARAGCDRSFVRYDSSRDRALNRYRWQSGRYTSYSVHRGRVYSDGFCRTNTDRHGGYRPSRGHYALGSSDRGGRYCRR